MKTTTQELLEDLKSGNIKPDCYYLEKEKHQIIDAVNEGIKLCDCEYDNEGNEYYIDNFS